MGQEIRPRAAVPRVRKQKNMQEPVVQPVQPVQPAQAIVPMAAEQELAQLRQYAHKMSKGSKAESIAFLQRAGIMDSRGNINKEYRA